MPSESTPPDPTQTENLDLVRSIYAAWERGDFRETEWADPEIELIRPESVDGAVLRGRGRAEGGWREWLTAWQDFHAQADEYRVLDDERVLVLGHMSGRGRASGAEGGAETVNLFHIHHGQVTRLVLYSSRERAFADLGLAD